MLVETGNGDKFSPKLKDIYGIDHDRAIGAALSEVGLAPDDIDTVVMTHLHFDHSGGTTRRTASGAVEPVFRRARHVVQRREWEDATHPHERNRASYLQENIGPLGEAGLLQLVDGETEIAPGVRVVPTPGHTAGHQSVLIGAARRAEGAVPRRRRADRRARRAALGDGLRPRTGAHRRDQARALLARAGRGLAAVWGHDRDHRPAAWASTRTAAFVVRELVGSVEGTQSRR